MVSNRSTPIRPLAATVVAAALALPLAACGSDGSTDSAKESKSPGRTVTDATGEKVRVPARPTRVVTLSELDLDSSLALGVRPVGLTAGRGQKGAPEYLRDQAKDIDVVGAVTGPDVEKVALAHPDVILAGQVADKQVLAQLRDIAPTVVTVGKGTDWKAALKLTGQTLNRTTEADRFLGDYDRRRQRVRKALGDRAGSTVSVARYSAKGTAVMQQGVFISEVLRDLGFERPGIQQRKGEGHSTPLSDENLDQIDGDWLFIGTLDSAGGDAELLDQLRGKAAYRQLGAVKKKHATEIDGSKWTSLGGGLAAMSVLDDIEKAMG